MDRLRSGLGCFPLIVSMLFGLDPAPGMLLVPLFCFITALMFAAFGIAVAASVAKIDQFNYVTTLFITPCSWSPARSSRSPAARGRQVASQLNPLHHLVGWCATRPSASAGRPAARGFLIGVALASGAWR